MDGSVALHKWLGGIAKYRITLGAKWAAPTSPGQKSTECTIKAGTPQTSGRQRRGCLQHFAPCLAALTVGQKDDNRALFLRLVNWAYLTSVSLQERVAVPRTGKTFPGSGLMRTHNRYSSSWSYPSLAFAACHRGEGQTLTVDSFQRIVLEKKNPKTHGSWHTWDACMEVTTLESLTSL